MNIENRENIGFKIISSMEIGSVEIVLGVRKGVLPQYVTWECRGGNDYYWGHYFSDLAAAQKDFCNRAFEKIEMREIFMNEHKYREEIER